jgi:hypothetical protein
MGSTFYMILAFSPVLPAVAGLILYQRVNPKVYFFIYAMWLSLITELLAAIALRRYDNMNASFFIYYSYICINIILYILFFYQMGVIKSKKLFYFLLAISLCACIKALFFPLRIYTLFGANLFCAAIILGLSTELLTKQILDVKNNGYKNFSFLMSTGAILFNSFFIFFVAIWFLGKDDVFKTNVYSVQKFVNVACYIIFGISLLCLPRTKNFLK